MVIFRTVVGVVLGYLVFAIASMLLVGPVMAAQGPAVVIASLVALALIGICAGAAAAIAAGGKSRIATIIVAVLIALATLANLMMGLGAEPLWYKLGSLLLTAPAVLFVGYWRQRPGGA